MAQPDLIRVASSTKELISKKNWDGDGVPLAESNCAGIGSDEDKAARKAAAQAEPAWAGAGEVVGILVWRVENFEMKAWDKKDYGYFYDGDSYVILVTEKDKTTGDMVHTIHFWLGENTTQDEMGTAAYKSVELSDLLDGGAHMSREVMSYESQQFKDVFKHIQYWKGGVETGFHHAAEGAYEPHLFQVRKTNKGGVRVKQVTFARDSMNQGDCFILDTGATIYVWEGTDTHAQEKVAAGAAAEEIESRREGKAKVTHEIDDAFWAVLGGEGEIKPASDGKDDIPEPEIGEGILFELSDASGALTMKEIARGELGPSMLNPAAVMMLDHGSEIFLWVGKDAGPMESRNAMCSAMNFLKANSKPSHTPIHMFTEGQTINNPIWTAVFKDGKSIRKSIPAVAPPSVAAAAAAAVAPAAAHAEFAGPGGATFSLADLQNTDVWHSKGVDASHREQYLNDADFQAAFEMSKPDFDKLPKWKKDEKKKRHSLF